MMVREEHLVIERTARLYLLGEPRRASDIWIACHGYGQLAGRFIQSFEQIAAPDRLVVAPEGLHRFYLDPPPAPAAQRRVGSTWMTREDRETDIHDYVAYLDRVAASLVGARETVRLRALGFSQGCATVFRWAAQGATRIDDLILWAGEVPADVELARAANRLAGTRITLVRGSHDVLTPAAAQQHDEARLRAAGLTVELREFEGGHELDANTLVHIV